MTKNTLVFDGFGVQRWWMHSHSIKGFKGHSFCGHIATCLTLLWVASYQGVGTSLHIGRLKLKIHTDTVIDALDVSWCILMYLDVSWCILMILDVSWCILMYLDVSWCILISEMPFLEIARFGAMHFPNQVGALIIHAYISHVCLCNVTYIHL